MRYKVYDTVVLRDDLKTEFTRGLTVNITGWSSGYDSYVSESEEYLIIITDEMVNHQKTAELKESKCHNIKQTKIPVPEKGNRPTIAPKKEPLEEDARDAWMVVIDSPKGYEVYHYPSMEAALSKYEYEMSLISEERAYYKSIGMPKNPIKMYILMVAKEGEA